MSADTTSTDYAARDLEPVTIHGRRFTVRELTFASGKSELMLTGPKGASYFLRDRIFRPGQLDDGVRQLVSFGSGQPFRVHGNEVRVVLIGDQLEEYVPAPKGARA